MQVLFGECVFDSGQRLVLRGDAPVHLTPKAFQLLELLVRERPRVLPKPRLMAELWPDTFVTEGGLANLITEIRKAVGDDPRQPWCIRTVHGVGYAFLPDGRSLRELVDAALPVRYELEGQGRIFRLSAGSCLVGRSADCDLRLESSTVSRHHAQVSIADAEARIEDLGSKNGTFVREQRVLGPTPLHDGDAVRLGSIELSFRVCSDASTDSFAPLRSRPRHSS
jgi:DNA-binding winged helix-turn-helix (wHTH) protein